MSRSQTGYSRLYVQAIFAVAAALALSTSACGKKDDAKPAPAPAAAPAATNTKTIGNVAGTGKSELDKNSGRSANEEIIEGVEKIQEPKIAGPVEGEGDTTQKPSSVVTEVPPSEREESVVYYDKSGLTRDQILAKRNLVNLTGPSIGEAVRSDIVSADGQDLFYTGAGQDTLRTHLYALVNERLATLDEATRAGDKALAQTIQLADFNVDWPSRRAELNFRFERLDRDGQVKMTKVKIEGPLNNVSKFSVGNVHYYPFIEAEVACMDISGGCKTVHIRVQDKTTGKVQTAHLIARHTNAIMDIDGTKPAGQSGNPEYDRLTTVLLNTTKNPTGENVVEKLTLTTSETIGGASNFAVNMRIRLQDQYGRRGGDVIELTGPLAKPRGSDELNVAANVTPQLTVIANEVVPTTALGVQNRFVDSISDVHLVKNNGQGVIQLDLRIRNLTPGGVAEKISLLFARIHTPTGPVRLQMQ